MVGLLHAGNLRAAEQRLQLAGMPPNINIMPKASSNRTVAAFIYDGLCTFEFGIAAEIFGLERPEMGPDWYRFLPFAEQPGAYRTNSGVEVSVTAGLEALTEAGTIVIPGWRTDGVAPSAPLARALREAVEQGARLVTICSGVFLPAACGLLSGLRVTTHWRHVSRLSALHPDLGVDPDVLYVDHGDIATSAGSAAGIDLLLHIVRKDFGAEAANLVARRLVMPAHREGGQTQYIERPVVQRAGGRLAPLLDAVRARPERRWTIAALAREAAMSERNFVRHFRKITGTSPGEWLVALRVDLARDLLESDNAPVEAIAAAAGFGGVATLRHHFRVRLGLSPTAYRARFSRRG
jgi:AraC family transcriptional regulator, transcriptional activator FtrA